MFKNYKNLRYDNPKFFEMLTDQLITMIQQDKADKQLIFFALNRLAFLNERKCFKKLYKVLESDN